MKSHVSRPFLREVENEFNRIYPYLRIEFPGQGSESSNPGDPHAEAALRQKAGDALRDDARLADSMTVSELETSLQVLFALPVQIFRKSGRLWIETKMTRSWTLKQQNDRGRELAAGEEG